MPSAFKFAPPAAAAVALMALSVAMFGPDTRSTASPALVPELVELRPGAVRFHASGEFSRDGRPVAAPLVTVSIERPLAVMKHQVTAAAYRRCVEAGACPMLDPGAVASDRPVIGVSWRNAQAYASWLSRETGMRFRLPSDEEWAYAAAERLADETLPDGLDSGDPGRRALAIYDREANREKSAERGPQPIGRFGMNANGLLDIAGNVWEWTDTCFRRSALDAADATAATIANCGVRVAQGRHRAYVPDFVGDARGTGCSIGTPPSHLGFRLVHDNDPWRGLPAMLRHVFAISR